MGTLHNKLVMQTHLIGWRCSIGCCSRESSPPPHPPTLHSLVSMATQNCCRWSLCALRQCRPTLRRGDVCQPVHSCSTATGFLQSHIHSQTVIQPQKHVRFLAVWSFWLVFLLPDVTNNSVVMIWFFLYWKCGVDFTFINSYAIVKSVFN